MRGRPRTKNWTPEEIEGFQQALANWLVATGRTPEELEAQLGYQSDGVYVRLMMGELQEKDRPPSEEFLHRLEEQGFEWNGKAPVAVHLSAAHGVYALADLPEGTIVVGEPQQCPECLAEHLEGKRPLARTYYVFSHPMARYCPAGHRRAWYRRKRWFKRCRELDCPWVQSLDGIDAYTCGLEDTCPKRRGTWW